MVLRAIVYVCFDYNLRNEGMTTGSICGTSRLTVVYTWPGKLYLLFDLLYGRINSSTMCMTVTIVYYVFCH